MWWGRVRHRPATRLVQGMTTNKRTLAAIVLAGSVGCATDPTTNDCVPGDLACTQPSLGKEDGPTTSSGMPYLPAPGGSGALTPWGGTDPTRWRPEAIMANAASQALNEAWSRSGVTDAIVA